MLCHAMSSRERTLFSRVDTPHTHSLSLSLPNSLQSRTLSHIHSLTNTHTPQPQKMTIAEKMGGSPFVRNGRNVLTKLTNKAPVKKLRGENTRLVSYCHVVVCCVVKALLYCVVFCLTPLHACLDAFSLLTFHYSNEKWTSSWTYSVTLLID